jgi:hypothetical protein
MSKSSLTITDNRTGKTYEIADRARRDPRATTCADQAGAEDFG